MEAWTIKELYPCRGTKEEIKIKLQVGVYKIRNKSTKIWWDKITICIGTNNIIGGLFQNLNDEKKMK